MERRIVLREVIKKIEENFGIKTKKLKKFDSVNGCYEIIFELIKINSDRTGLEERNQNKIKIKKLEDKIKLLKCQVTSLSENEKNRKESFLKRCLNKYILKI